MRKLGRARRRVVLMACCGTMVAASSPLLERALMGALHVPAVWIVLPTVGLEVVWVAFVVVALSRLKAAEACEAAEKGSGEA
jgi:hypothetical protein